MTTLEMLLNQLANGNNPALPPAAPSAPIPLIAPAQTPGPVPSLGVLPPPDAPVAPMPAQDTNFINQYAGPQPTPPPAPSKLQRIFAAIGGFGEGYAGRGPEYLRSLRAPQQAYERANEQYQARRTQGIELEQRRRERQQEFQTRLAERQADRDLEVWAKNNNISDTVALENIRQTNRLQLEAKRQALQQEAENKREMARKELDAREISGRYFTVSKNRALSDELGKYYAGLKDSLSPAAATLDKRVQHIGDVQMGRSARVGAGRTGASSAAMKAVQNFEASKQAVIQAVGRGDVRTERLARRKMDAAFGQLARYPGQIEYGGDPNWPYAKLIGGQSAPAQPGAQPQAAPSPARAQSKAKLMSVGYSDAEAEAELNRLGIR